jgi:hypothetical protein
LSWANRRRAIILPGHVLLPLVFAFLAEWLFVVAMLVSCGAVGGFAVVPFRYTLPFAVLAAPLAGLLVDGQDVARQALGLGDFELRATVPPIGAWQRRVELRFSATQQLPPPDTRQVGARVQFVGFEGD